MKKIYVAHPHLGKRSNKRKVEKIIKRLFKENPDMLYISPIHTFGFIYFDVEYYYGLTYCLKLLESCDELWLCEGWEKSEGCKIEHDYAKKHGIPIKYL